MTNGLFSMFSSLIANTPPYRKGLSSRKFLSLFLILFLAVGNVWAYTYNHATSVPEWTVNFSSWNGESDASGATASTVHNPRLYWNGSSYKNNLGTAQDIAFDGGGFYYIYEPNEARQLPTGSALSALSYVVAKAQGTYFKYNQTSSTVSSPATTIYGLTTNSSQKTDVTYEFHMPRAGYVRLLIGTDSNGDPTGTANDAWKNVTLSGATIGDVAVTYHASGSKYDVKTKTGATTFSTVTYTSAGKKMRSVEFALNSGTTTMTTNPAKLSNNSGTARKMFIYAVEVYLESAASYTITYDANGGTNTMENTTNTVADCEFTYSGKDFVEWNTKEDGTGESYAPGDNVTKDLDLYAIWTNHVAKYTLIYKVDGVEVDRETVNVSATPEGITAPTKDCYTFAGWSPALDAVSGTDGAEVYVDATWTANYSTSATLISDDVVSGKPNVNTVFAASNIVSSITFASGNYEFTSNETKKGYYGYKDKQSGDNMKILVQQGKQVQVLFGNLGSDPTITANGVAKSLDASRATGDNVENTFTYTASAADALISITMGSGTNTLKKVDIVQLYTATRVDAKSDGAGSDPNVAETTLPTPTAVSGWTYTGWIANQDVKDSEDNTKTAGTTLSAGTYTLLANTTFTAQWIEVTGTYDITYVSDHGTAPTAENAASVVLTELSEEGWAHKGWTANVDVTVDAATVTAGTLIANGKTAILASDVTFTAVWKEIFTVTFDSKDGSSVDPVDIEDGASLDAAPTAPTKENYVFLGWSETDGGPVVADITTLTITDNKTLYAKWALDVQVTEIVFSNSFKGWINGSNITVFYMAGESAPNIVSYDGTNLKAADAVSIVGNEVVAIGSDDNEKHYTLTMTAVSPLTATGEQIFDGSEGYVKTRHAWTNDKKWKMSRYDTTDDRIPRGDCSLYIFLGAAESVTLDWGAQKVTDDVAVYVNGTFVKNIGKNNNSAIPLTGGNNMVALYSLQTSGDIYLNGLTVVAYVPTTGVALTEGEDAISSKTIWAGTNFTLTATVTPDNASDKTITWTSSDDAIATVVNGVVTGVAASATPVTITATTVDGKYATCEVTVTTAPAPCETPTINTQPATQAYCAGSEPTLTVAASVGEGTLHYAWFKDDVVIGSDAATCLVDGAGTYKVVVTNHVDGKLDASVTSDNAVITLNVAAAITTQPTNKSEIVSGSSVTLSLVATNATSYQWYSCDDAEKTNAAAISGAEAADYVFTCTANGYYYCEVGNACGAAVVSNVVSVKLEPEGCNVLDGTIPTAAPYIYDNSEWTLYAVTSGGKLDGSNRFKDAKDFDDNTVKVIEYSRIGMTFAKDVESLTFYATASSTGRTINKIQVTSDDITTGTPTYADVDADLASATMPGQTKQYIFTADNMLLEAGKKYWIAFSGTVDIFKICYTEALAKPTIPTLSNQELCVGEDFAEIDATSSKTGDGTLSYQWYNATDEENPVAISGATDAKYTPTADGKYYVEVTNAAAGHVSNKAKSNTITMVHFASAEITTAPENVRMDAGETATLAVVATGKNVTYQWYTCKVDGSDATEIDGATAASYEVTVGTGVQYYKVVVSSDCGTPVEAVVKVEEWTELPLADVTGAITWDFSKAVTAETTLPSGDAEIVLANVAGVVLNGEFESNKLKVAGTRLHTTYIQAKKLMFHATIPGKVTIEFSNTGNKDYDRILYVNGIETTAKSKNQTHVTYSIVVPAGDVVIQAWEKAAQPEDETWNLLNIYSLSFSMANYIRTGLTVGSLGTICLPSNVPAGHAFGATFYELEGKEPQYGKIVFDEILSGELAEGVPYLFQAQSDVLYCFYGTESVAEPDNSGAMKGTFVDLTLTGSDLTNIYYFAQKALWSCVDLSSLYVPANRAYVKMDEMPAYTESNPAPGVRRITLGVNGQQVATGVDQVQGDEAPTKMIINGQLFILRGEKMYDAQGKLVK